MPDQFTVEWDGTEVINSGLRGVDGTYDGNVVVVDGAASGTLSFNKTTASPTTAIARVISPYTGTSWQFSLGCPGGGTPPYPPSSLGDWGTFNLVATTYGEDTYHSGTTFTLTARVEKAIVTMLGADVLPLSGTAFAGSMQRVNPGQFTGGGASNWTLVIASDGTASISDTSDTVATRPAGDLNDPTGYYTATLYGAAAYNGGKVYGTHVSQAAGKPLPGRAYILVTESAPGAISTATGPYFGSSLPSPADPIYPQELAEITSGGELVQVQDGTVIWAPASGGGGGGEAIPWVTLTSDEYLALGTPDADTIYDISDAIP